MALPVYTVSMLQQQGVDGELQNGPPPGKRWIIKDVDVYANVTFASREVHVIGPGGQTFYWQSWGTEDQFSAHWEGRIVVDHPDVFTVTTSDNVDVSICGYEFDLPPTP